MKKLAIIGASYLQLPLVEKAQAMGIETHCFAWEDGAVCKDISDYYYPISIVDKDKIYELCANIGIDGITTIATDVAVPTVSFVAEKLNLIGNSTQVAFNSTNKGAMRGVFLNHNCSIPGFLVIEGDKHYECNLSFPVIVKPVDRSGSRGVTKVSNSQELDQAVQYARQESFCKTVIVEEFIEGCEVSVESVSWKGTHHIITITDKITSGHPYFVELEHHQPSMLAENIQAKIRQETLKCLNALGIQYGASHAELKITEDGRVYIIEVGARMGGDFIGAKLVELSTGYDFIQGVIDIALNKFTPPANSCNKYSGVYFLSKDSERLLPYFEKKTEFEVEKELQNNNLVRIKNSSERSGYLIYQSNSKIEI